MVVGCLMGSFSDKSFRCFKQGDPRSSNDGRFENDSSFRASLTVALNTFNQRCSYNEVSSKKRRE